MDIDEALNSIWSLIKWSFIDFMRNAESDEAS